MKLITNQENLKLFVFTLTEGWYYIFIVARRKWYESLSEGEIPIHRIFCKKEDILNKLNEAESYTFLDRNGVEIPVESIGVYINPNIRDFRKGSLNLVRNYFEKINQFKTTEDKNFLKSFSSAVIDEHEYLENPLKFLEGCNAVLPLHKQICKFAKSEMKTVLSNSRGERKWMDIDIDCLIKGEVDRELLKPIFEKIYLVTEGRMNVVMTRGGAHVLLDSSTINKRFVKSWYVNLQNMKNQFEGFEIDFQGGNDKLVPCPGTIQGGYFPNFEIYF